MKKNTNTKQLMILAIITCLSFTAFSQWTNISPNLPGRMTSILASKTDPNVLLAASPGGGIWKTLNNGASWAPTLNYGLSDYTVNDLQWDKIQANRILASTNNGLYATTDFGDHWTCLTSSCGYPSMIKLDADNLDRKNLAQLTYTYNATVSSIFYCSPRRGIYYSNNGSSFTQFFPFPTNGNLNPDNDICALAVDNATGYIYFATSNIGPWIPKVFRSTSPWTPTTTPAAMSWTQVYINTSLTDRAVKGITSTSEANKLALAIDGNGSISVFTTTNGVNWNPTLTQPYNSIGLWDSRVICSPGANQLFLGCLLPFYSNDFGATWVQFTAPADYVHPDIASFYWASYPSGSYLWLTTDGYSNLSTGAVGSIVRYNFTSGSTPTFNSHVGLNGLKTWQAYYIEALYKKPLGRRLFIGSQDNFCLMSNNNGINWQMGGAATAADGYYMSIAKTTYDGYAYKDNSPYCVEKTSDAASITNPTWSYIPAFPTTSNPVLSSRHAISIDPTNAQRFCTIDCQRIKLTTDGGASVNTLALLPGNANPTCVFLDTDGFIYVGTKDNGVFRSPDDGLTWKAWALNTNSPKLITKIVHSDYGGGYGTFYYGTSNGLYRSTTSGLVLYSSGYLVSDIEVHPTQSNKLYIGYGYGGAFIRHYGGVAYSLDGGQTFNSLSSGQTIHNSPITDIKIDPIDNNLIYVATYGLGVWSYHL
jgi:hypothetical protein